MASLGPIKIEFDSEGLELLRDIRKHLNQQRATIEEHKKLIIHITNATEVLEDRLNEICGCG